MNSSLPPPGPRTRNSLTINRPLVAVGPKNGLQANAVGVTISDQPLSVPVSIAAWSETSTRHVPRVLASFILLSSPTGSCGPNPSVGQLGELAIGNQLPVYGACALVASKISPAAWLSITMLVMLSPSPPPATAPPMNEIRSTP